MEQGPLTHLDHEGTARMVDVTAQSETTRTARARAVVRMSAETAERVRGGDLPKGDVAAVARLAAIAAAKRTDELIPLCHGLPLTLVDCDIEIGEDSVTLTTLARTSARTGVEMEAMTAAAIGALAVYDMVKGVERGVTVEKVELLSKTGGKEDWIR